MTMNDAFDERLRAAFAAAQPGEDEADAFVKKVKARMSHPVRRRAIILGGAGSTGSAIAGTQLEGLFNTFQIPAEGWTAQLAAIASPEVMATTVLALMIGGFAFILPKRI
ncbi:hypothetical protein [Hyphobacterium marinum]|uniref:Uncharacterized protein n=1 Tax=Hyphobacterium marinum TaxID=3116574 RepID=A0ABU7M046_9PROT|nr:hypothetical protein [Hyphobacterium sp. Y6023]MEE2567163.1 hypothetical protein [Hyphobacterium sp. Y6023]